MLNNYNTDFLVEEISDYQKLETSKDLLKTIEQQYLYDYEYNPSTGTTEFSYIGIGSSRLSELVKYGNTGYTQDLVIDSKTENDETINYFKYFVC